MVERNTGPDRGDYAEEGGNMIIASMSVRKFIVVSVVTTYCLSAATMAIAFLCGKIDIAAFLGVFNGVAGLVGVMSERYFGREDRKKEVA